MDSACGIAANASLSVRAIEGPDKSSDLRRPNSSRMTKIVAAFGRFAPLTAENPVITIVCATPAVARMIRSASAATTRVRAMDDAGGS